MQKADRALMAIAGEIRLMVCISNEEGIGPIGECRYRLNTFSDGPRNLAVIPVCPNGLYELAPISELAR